VPAPIRALGTTYSGKNLLPEGGTFEENLSMCDYSLHSVASRPARAGDELITSSFAATLTRGFAAVDKPGVAVCLLPGTELAFENDVQWDRPLSMWFRKKGASGRLVRFRQVNPERRETHHDAIEFPNGYVVLLTHLRPKQKATVLQLPINPHMARQRPMEGESSVRVIDLEPIHT
jgi:hypothetical protein